MLTNDEMSRVLQAVREWAESAPNEPVLGFLGSEALTPNQMLHEMQQGSEEGRALLGMVEHAARREGFAKTLGRLRASQESSIESSSEDYYL